MIFRSVFHVLPALVFYTRNRRLMPPGVAGRAIGPLILIRPEYLEDQGIHLHELEHVRQWYLTAGLHPLLYALFRRYRLWAEVRAYRKQMKYPKTDGTFMSLYSAAIRLARLQYRLHITVAEAIKALEAV